MTPPIDLSRCTLSRLIEAWKKCEGKDSRASEAILAAWSTLSHSTSEGAFGLAIAEVVRLRELCATLLVDYGGEKLSLVLKDSTWDGAPSRLDEYAKRRHAEEAKLREERNALRVEELFRNPDAPVGSADEFVTAETLRRECEECEGKGIVECDLDVEHDCEECDGTGKMNCDPVENDCESIGFAVVLGSDTLRRRIVYPTISAANRALAVLNEMPRESVEAMFTRPHRAYERAS